MKKFIIRETEKEGQASRGYVVPGLLFVVCNRGVTIAYSYTDGTNEVEREKLMMQEKEGIFAENITSRSEER